MAISFSHEGLSDKPPLLVLLLFVLRRELCLLEVGLAVELFNF